MVQLTHANRLSRPLDEADPEVASILRAEEDRQRHGLQLIASENVASRAVRAAVGSCLTNKYAEGYPGKRYYGGCEFVDIAEQLAIDRARQLFSADYANVQPHSGSQANGAAYLALLDAGDTVLGMSLADGGHLSHGAKVNFSGKIYCAVQYGLNADTGEVRGNCVRAEVTVTFQFSKRGFEVETAKPFLGRLVVADIGIPEICADDEAWSALRGDA